MDNVQEMPKVQQMPKSFPLVWALHSAGQMFGIMVAMTWMYMFWQDYIGLSPVFIAGFLFIARLFDLVMSIISGPIVQKTRSKWGQFRPWILGCVIVVQIGCVMMFLDTGLPLAAKGIIAGVGYLLQNAPMNFFVGANNGLMAKTVGPDMDGRVKVAMFAMRGTNTANIVISAIMWPLIAWFNSIVSPNGFLIVNCIFGAIWICTTIVVFTLTKPYDSVSDQPAGPAPSMIAMYKDIIKNREVVVLFVNNLLMMLFTFGLGSMATYYWLYSVGSMDLQPVNATLMSVLGLVGAFFIAPIGRKLGKRKSYLISTIAGIVVNTLHGFFSHGQPYVFMGLSSVMTLFMGFMGAVGINLWLDAAEKQLYETGVDTRAATMNVSSIGMKVALVLSSIITPFFMQFIGYTQHYDAQGVFLFAETLHPERINMALNWFNAVVSCFTLAMFLLFYKITDEKAAFYASENQKRAMEQMAAMGGGPGGPGGPFGPGPGGPGPGGPSGPAEDGEDGQADDAGGDPPGAYPADDA